MNEIAILYRSVFFMDFDTFQYKLDQLRLVWPQIPPANLRNMTVLSKGSIVYVNGAQNW